MANQFYPQVGHPFHFELNKDMEIAAAHFIPHPDAGKCSNVHGHGYVVNITVAGNKLDKLGFLTNFQKLKKAVHGRYDHSLMNDHPEFAKTQEELEEGLPAPSTEAVAKRISDIVQEVLDEEGNEVYCVQVIVRETPTSYVVYRAPMVVETSILHTDDTIAQVTTTVMRPEVSE